MERFIEIIFERILCESSTNWSCVSAPASDDRRLTRVASRPSAAAVCWSAEACLQSYWQFSRDHSKTKEFWA